MRRMTSDLVYLPHRAILTLRGPDTVVMLERLVTHATTDWQTGEIRYGALLTPQGKVIADYLALRTEDGVWLDVSREHAADLAKRLKLFRLRSAVEIELDEDLIVFAGLAPCTNPPAAMPGAVQTYRDPRYPEGRLRMMANKRDSATTGHALSAFHMDRMAHAVPEQGTDFGAADVFPAEINMDILGGVALNKGCFVGQEVVSRMHRRGKLRKRTLRVDLPGDTKLEPGDEIKAPLSIGTVTSAVAGQALAILRVDRLAAAQQAGERPTVHETPVTIEIPAWLEAELAPMEER
jgi:hypothetical protein